MKRMIFTLITATCIFVTTNIANAQQQAQPFSLDNLFNMDIGELFNQLEQEMSATERIWDQFLNPGMMDTSLQQLKGFIDDGTFDTILDQLQLQMGDMGDMGSMIDQLMNQFNMPGMQNIMPFNFNMPGQPSTPKPKDFDEGEWNVVPNIPNTTPKPKKENVSEI